MAQAMLEQFKREAAGTRKALERVPFEKAEWAPLRRAGSGDVRALGRRALG